MTKPQSQATTARQVWRLMFDVLMETGDKRAEALTRRNLTPNDSRALSFLDRDMGYPIGTLARRLGCDPSTATWVVDRLEREGLAERRASPEDRRVKLVSRTPLGDKVMNAILEEFYEPPETLSRLNEAELTALRRLLEKLRAPEHNGRRVP